MAHLASLPDKSLDGIFASHLVEHLPFPVLVRFLQECYRVLKYDTYLICETPNSANVIVGAHEFYIDPGHFRPMHHQLLAYLARTSGFREVTFQFLSPWEAAQRVQSVQTDAEGNHGVSELAKRVDEQLRRIDEALHGPRDYAIIARK